MPAPYSSCFVPPSVALRKFALTPLRAPRSVALSLGERAESGEAANRVRGMIELCRVTPNHPL